MKKQNLKIENNKQELKKIYPFMDVFCKRNNVPSDVFNEVTLSIDELVTNIISYAFDDNEQHYIDIDVEVEGNLLCVILKDEGREFNPLTYPEVDIKKSLDEMKIGGLGIHIVRNLMDEIVYKRENNFNVLIIKKSFSKNEN